MSIAYRVQDYIAEHDVPWDPVAHRASACSIDAAHAAHVPPDSVAKAVVLRGDGRHFVVVIPANHRLDLAQVAEDLGQCLSLASEGTLGALFCDCAQGAIPPLGDAYGIPTFWDASLADRPDVYFEGGDHQTLVHMDGVYFAELMRSARPLMPH